MNGKQNKIFHALLGQLKYGSEAKMLLVASFSDNRTTSSKELTDMEALLLIRHLNNLVTGENQQENPAIKQPEHKLSREEWLEGATMRNTVKYYASQLNWDSGISDKEFYDKIDAFCLKQCVPKKKLNKYTAKELVAVVTVFKNIYSKELKTPNPANEQTGSKQIKARPQNA